MNSANNCARLKRSILLAALILSSYVLTTGASTPGNAVSAPADGSALYTKHCGLCHGADGRGKPVYRKQGQPDFTGASWQKAHTDAQIAAATKNGKGKMPAFKSKLSDQEITAVVARVRAFGKK